MEVESATSVLSHFSHGCPVWQSLQDQVRFRPDTQNIYKVQDRHDHPSTGPSAAEHQACQRRRCSVPGGSACTRWFSSWSVWACPGNSSSHLWPSPAGDKKEQESWVKGKFLSAENSKRMFLCFGLGQTELVLQHYFQHGKTNVYDTRPFHIFKKCLQISIL